jgi:hypothetical protein
MDESKQAYRELDLNKPNVRFGIQCRAARRGEGRRDRERRGKASGRAEMEEMGGKEEAVPAKKIKNNSCCGPLCLCSSFGLGPYDGLGRDLLFFLSLKKRNIHHKSIII